MIVTIHQPDFLPWLGFFDRWKKSDIYIVLDDVQYIRRGWQNRDRIKTAHGIQWLTVPVISKGRYYQHIQEVMINNEEHWVQEHLALIREAYRKAPYFKDVFPEIEEIYTAGYEKLIDLNMAFLKCASRWLHISTPLVYSSEQHVSGTKTERLVNLVKAVGGTQYVTGLGSKDYLEERLFEENAIQISWQSFELLPYEQLHGKFEAGLSVLDYVMMRGKQPW